MLAQQKQAQRRPVAVALWLAGLLVSGASVAGPTELAMSPYAAAPTDDAIGNLLSAKGLSEFVQSDSANGNRQNYGLADRFDTVTQVMRSSAADMVVTSMAFLGVPYQRGGNGALRGDAGFDCSGFVRAMVEQTVGLLLPRKAEQQAAHTTRIARAELQPGDLVFFNTLRRAFSHVGIYVGEGKFIHSPKPGQAVRVEDMTAAYWVRRFDGARRVAALDGLTH